MLLEHAFITTVDAQPTLRAAGELLAALGFRPEQPAEPDALTFQRGKRNPARAKRVSELPQRVWLTFDRGRVTLAATVQEFRKTSPLHREMLLALAHALEQHLAHAQPLETARAQWDDLHRRIGEQAAAARRRRLITLVILLAIIIGAPALAIWLASRS